MDFHHISKICLAREDLDLIGFGLVPGTVVAMATLSRLLFVLNFVGLTQS